MFNRDGLHSIAQKPSVDPADKSLLKVATPGEQLQMSARAYHRTPGVKLARTIADLAGSDTIETVHLAEPFSIGRGGCGNRSRADGVDCQAILGYSTVNSS